MKTDGRRLTADKLELERKKYGTCPRSFGDAHTVCETSVRCCILLFSCSSIYIPQDMLRFLVLIFVLVSSAARIYPRPPWKEKARCMWSRAVLERSGIRLRWDNAGMSYGEGGGIGMGDGDGRWGTWA